MSEIEPGTPEQTAEALADAAGGNRTIELGGAFSKRRQGGPASEADVTLSTRQLNRVLAYEPADLTMSVEAGMPWARLEQVLAENGQMLPLDPPFSADATVGGVVATNGSGPRRRLYGTARDLVIGMEFATLEGKLVQSGGMVVKNVTGLDMAKLMIGSFGTLAAMTRVNFKIFPRPAQRRTFLFRSDDVGKLIELRRQMLRGQAGPTALDLGPEEDGYILSAEAGGSATLLDRYRRDYEDLASGGKTTLEVLDDGDSHWTAARTFHEHAQSKGQCVVRVSSTPTRLVELPPLVETADEWILRAANGVLYASVAPEVTGALVSGLRAAGFQTVLEQGPDEVKATVEAWDAPGSDFQVMQRLKKTFDPESLLNRGRFFGRL